MTGVAGTTGGGVLVHKLINKNTISKNISSSYLLRDEDTAKWDHRIKLLKSVAEGDLSKELLVKRREDEFSIDDLKRWCSESLKAEFLGKEDKRIRG